MGSAIGVESFGRRWLNLKQQQPFDKGYQHLLDRLVLQGKRRATIDAYSRAVRRVRDYFDTPPDELKTEQLRDDGYCIVLQKNDSIRSS